MLTDKQKSIIDKLIYKTLRDEAIWNKTSGPDGYQLLLRMGSVTINRWEEDINSPETIKFTILNDKGETIEDELVVVTQEQDYELLLKLHTTVRRKYLKADQVLDNLLKELNGFNKIGDEKEPDKNDLPF